jgi:hypothetical protein
MPRTPIVGRLTTQAELRKNNTSSLSARFGSDSFWQLLFSPLWMPLWAAYHLGQGNWAQYGRSFRVLSILFLILWALVAVLILAAPLLHNLSPAFFDSLAWYKDLIPVAVGVLVLSYIVGWLMARFRPAKPDESQTNTWM